MRFHMSSISPFDGHLLIPTYTRPVSKVTFVHSFDKIVVELIGKGRGTSKGKGGGRKEKSEMSCLYCNQLL